MDEDEPGLRSYWIGNTRLYYEIFDPRGVWPFVQRHKFQYLEGRWDLVRVSEKGQRYSFEDVTPQIAMAILRITDSVILLSDPRACQENHRIVPYSVLSQDFHSFVEDHLANRIVMFKAYYYPDWDDIQLWLCNCSQRF